MDSYNREFVRLMAEAGWTASDCVNRLGLSKGAISQYRNGITRPSLQVLRLFSSLAGVALALPGERPPPDPMSSVSDQERAILLTLRRIPAAQRTAIADMLIAVAGPAPEREDTVETKGSAIAAAEIVKKAAAIAEAKPSQSAADASSEPESLVQKVSTKLVRAARKVQSS